ncbi:hypothetical protein LTS18_009523, partial [Coniosporium uncinatum]
MGQKRRRAATQPQCNPGHTTHLSLRAILEKQKQRELVRLVEEVEEVEEEEDEAEESIESELAPNRNFEDEGGFTDEDMNRMDSDEVDLEEEQGFETQPTQLLNPRSHAAIVTARDVLAAHNDEIATAATALLGLTEGSVDADEYRDEAEDEAVAVDEDIVDEVDDVPTFRRATRSLTGQRQARDAPASTAPTKLSSSTAPKARLKQTVKAKEVQPAPTQKSKEKAVKLKLNMSKSKASKPKLVPPISKPRQQKRRRLESPIVVSLSPSPPPPPVRFQSTWRVQIEGEEKDIWQATTIETARSFNLITAHRTARECKQAIARKFVNDWQLLKLTAISIKEKGKDKPETASATFTSYSELDKVNNLMATVKYWAARGGVVIKVDCIVYLRVELEAPVTPPLQLSENSTGSSGHLVGQLLGLLGGLAQGGLAQGGAKTRRKSSTQQQRLNLPSSSLVEALTGNPGPLIINRWPCQADSCSNFSNSCYSLPGVNRDLANNHFPLNADLIRLWGQSIKACRDGSITSESPPVAVALKLGVARPSSAGGSGESRHSRSRDAAPQFGPNVLGTPYRLPSGPPPAYAPQYAPPQPYSSPYPGQGSLLYSPTPQPVEERSRGPYTGPTSSPIGDEEETEEAMRKFFEYLSSRPGFIGTRELLSRLQ